MMAMKSRINAPNSVVPTCSTDGYTLSCITTNTHSSCCACIFTAISIVHKDIHRITRLISSVPCFQIKLVTVAGPKDLEQAPRH